VALLSRRHLLFVPEHDLFVFIIQGAIMSPLLKIKKPTVGFWARFFGQAPIFRKTLTDNNMHVKKPSKREKVQNKMLFLGGPLPVFLPKGSKSGPFLLSVRFIGADNGLSGVDGE
jgi:hypothetical protein